MGKVELNISSNINELLVSTDKLNTSIKELSQTTENYQKRNQTAFKNAEDATKTLNKGIAQQEKLLKDLTLEYLQLSSNASKLNANEKKRWQEVNSEIQKTKENITLLKSKQADLGVETNKSTAIYSKLSGIISGAFSAYAVINFTKAVIASTDSTQDAFDRFKEGSKEAFGFLLRAVATADFSNLISGMRSAFEEGKRYADVLDEIRLRQEALGLFKSTLDVQIAEQKLIARNFDNALDLRRAAIDQIITLEKQKLDETLAISNRTVESELRNAAIATGIDRNNEEAIQRRIKLIKEYIELAGTNEGFKSLEKQIDAAKELETWLNSLITTDQTRSGFVVRNTAAYENALKSLTPEQQKLLDLLQIESILNEDKRKQIIAAMSAQNNAVKEEIDSETALQRLRHQLENEFLKQEGDAAKIREDAAKQTEQNLKDFQEAMSGGLQTLNESVDNSEANLKDFSEIMQQNMYAAGYSTKEMADEAEKNLKDFTETMYKELAALEKFASDHPFWASIGLTDEGQIQQIKEFAGQVKSFIDQIVAQQVEESTRLVEDLNNRIDEQEEATNRELELKKEGLANNYEIEKAALTQMQKQRDAATKEQQRNIQIQKNLSLVESGIAMTTTIANIMKGFSSIPIVGWALGLLAVGSMIAGFILANRKAKEAIQMEHGGEATYGLLKGKRHREGGIPIEAEEGEFFTNRQSTQKYLPLLEAINKDDRESMKLFFDRKFVTKLPQQKGFDIDKSKKLGEITNLMKKPKSEIVYGENYIIERIGSYTKKINLN